VALQGTIDAFPVVDVLQLLAGSRKTGRLIVEGDRSTAQLFVVDGATTAGGVQDAGPLEVADVVVELLRYSQGSFLFEPGSIAPDPSEPEDLMTLVAGAGQRLEQWAAIEAAIPSMAHRLSLVTAIDAEGVTIGADDWPLIVAAGAGERVSDAIDALGLPQLEACGKIVELAERQLLEVGPPSVELVHVPVTVEPSVVEVVDEGVGDAVTGRSRSGGSAEALVLDADPIDADPIDADAIDDAIVDDVIDDAIVDDATYEVVLMDGDDDGSFPEHFPIDDLVGGAEQEDPWVLLETAGKEDRLAAAQSFDGDPDPGAGIGAFSSGAFSSDGFSSQGFGSDGFGSDGLGAPVRTGDEPGHAVGSPGDAAAWTSSTVGGFTDAGAFTDPVESFDAGAPIVGPTTQSAAFVGDGAFTAAPLASPVAVQSPDLASDSAADEVLRQMSKLSPKAAEAIAAALGSAAEDQTRG